MTRTFCDKCGAEVEVSEYKNRGFMVEPRDALTFPNGDITHNSVYCGPCYEAVQKVMREWKLIP